MTTRRLTVHPGPPPHGLVAVPGDKSITHRAYLMGLIAAGRTRVEEPNPGADCEATLSAAAGLGAVVSRADSAVTIRGCAGSLAEPEGVLECGNSGTTLRLLAGVLAAQPFFAVLSGDASLRRRPMDRVIEPLRRMGAFLQGRGGDRFPPLAVRGGALRPISYALPMASAQVASCVALAALAAPGETVLELPGPARDHTERMLAAFGAEVTTTARAGLGPRLVIHGPARLEGTTVRVPGDPSAAAFFLAAAAARPGGSVRVENLCLNPTRLGLLDVLERMGARVERESVGRVAGEEIGTVVVTGPERLQGFDVPPEWLPRMIDEVPAWTIAAASASGTSRLHGAAELRAKESDRLSALAAGLARLGVEVAERPDGLEITGGPVGGGSVEARGDHRIAMAFAALGLGARAPVTVDDASSIETSFPGFEQALRGLGAEVDAVPAGGVPRP